MRKLAWLFFIMLLAGCGATAVSPTQTISPTQAPTDAPTAVVRPLSDRIVEVEGLTVDDVQAIWRFDDSRPPDTPSRIVYREKDLKGLLEALQGIRLTTLLAPTQTVAPGDYYSYRVFLFNGEILDIHFNSFRVISQQQSRGYQNSAPVQQAIDGMQKDPYLLGDDAYEAVEQLTISNKTGEHRIKDRKQIEGYVRMFCWMTITGRSQEPLTDGDIYTFRHKNGKETMLQYRDDLLATAEGTYHVKPNPEYAIAQTTAP